jgi:hypothetical protein
MRWAPIWLPWSRSGLRSTASNEPSGRLRISRWKVKLSCNGRTWPIQRPRPSARSTTGDA